MNKNIKRISIFLKDSEKKKWGLIFKEVFQLTVLKKQFPLFYFGRLFYKKDAPSPFNFMNFKEYRKIIYSPKLERKSAVSILKNKLNFFLFCQSHSLPTPKLIGYNLYNSFVFNEKVIIINNDIEFLDYISSIFKNYEIKKIFVKQSESKGGKGILLLSKKNIEKSYKKIWSIIKKDSYVFQEPIQQHKDINNIFPNSINTIRIETYLDKNNQIHILGGFMRFGSGKSFIDNVGSGGFMIPINFNEGKLKDKGFTAMINGSNSITKHPTTNFNLAGFKIPFFKESIELCKKFALLIPNRIIGWDVAITPNGPIIIEGNHDSAIIAGELSYGGYKNKPIFKEILSEI